MILCIMSGLRRMAEDLVHVTIVVNTLITNSIDTNVNVCHPLVKKTMESMFSTGLISYVTLSKMIVKIQDGKSLIFRKKQSRKKQSSDGVILNIDLSPQFSVFHLVLQAQSKLWTLVIVLRMSVIESVLMSLILTFLKITTVNV